MKYYLHAILLVLTCGNYFDSRCQTPKCNIGINLCGAEFGDKNLPGILNQDYIYPTEKEIEYFVRKGFRMITLPFKWERIQHLPGEELDSLELFEMRQFIKRCNKYDVKVTLTMQNFAAYQKGNKEFLLGSSKLSFTHYRDVWKKIAFALLDEKNIYGFDIMNEPRKIFDRAWFNAAQNAINGIREVDTLVYIIIDGENSSFAFDWKFDNNKLKDLKDPYDKIIYDAHCYFDFDHSGRYDSKYERKVDPNMGVTSVQPFIEWLKKNNKKGIIGEFGVPANDSRWLAVMDNFLDYINKNGISANYWAAGPWWKDYELSIQPVDGIDRPQMQIIEKYLR